MSFDTAAGASLAISAAVPPDFDEAGFEGLTWDTIGEITNIGEFGREYALVSHNPLASRGTKKAKGSYNNGTLSPSLAMDAQDGGQALLRQAALSDDPAPLRVRLDDGTIYYLMGLVMSYRPNVGTVDDVVTATCSIEVTEHDIIEVQPDAAATQQGGTS